ncbi:MAG: DUF4388 domain-containing protein [Actinobacteria bacterium]|nr:DUF4388 domain-containing protein [Actinomycetota bacterium]
MKGISLSSVIQVINLEKQSCDIQARADGQSGQLHFRDGALVDAVADGLEGEDAAYEILGWRDPEFEVSTEDTPRDRMIEADLTQMLLEIARRQDEELEESARSAAAQDPVPPRLEPLASPAGDASGNGRGTDQSTAETIQQLEAAFEEAGPESEMEAALEPIREAEAATAASAGESAATAASAPAAAAPAAGAAPSAGDAGPSAGAAGAASPAALNVAGLRKVVQIAHDGLGDALLSADLFSSADGTSYVGVNSQPAVCALVNQVTERMTWAFDKGGLPPLGRYYMAELAGSRMLLVAPCGGFQLILVVDTSRVQLGLLLNVVLPEVLAALEEVSPR